MTVDGGATWRQSKLPGVPNELYGYAIAATDADHVWVLRASPESTADSAAFVLYRTSDGGTTWQAAPVPGDPSLGMWLLFWNDTDGTLTTAKTPSEYRGYRTTDGGASWHEAGICQPNAVVTMSDKTTWWSSSAGMARMGGPEALLQMTGTCGRSWTNVRVAGLPNMSGVSLGIPAPPTFFNATTGYLAVNRSNDDGSKSWAQGYRTLDAGRTWAPVGSPTPHWLNWLSFADATHWVGESVDPQLRTVITDDAGKTWREVPRPDDASWFGSSAFGAWFVDARHGFSPAYFPDQPIALAGARHARSAPDLAATVYQTLLVTSDGGVTWVPAHFPS